jgi:molybdopterin molybdotransferase
MQIDIHLTQSPILKPARPAANSAVGAWVEFSGLVRGEENSEPIAALEYEAYPEMAHREIRRLLTALGAKYPCQAALIIHRFGLIPVGETAIYAAITAPHRGEAFALLAEFMTQLKQDVPIWKRRSLPAKPLIQPNSTQFNLSFPHTAARPPISLTEAITEICSHSQPLPPVRTSLAEAMGRVLREDARATADMPAHDLSTRDGYAILAADPSARFQIVDTLYAADWKPRSLQPGQAVHVATGANLPCGQLRVVMQENAQRNGDWLDIVNEDRAENIRRRGEEFKAGQLLVPAGARLDAGKLALLAATGCVRPLVSKPLRVLHFTTGNEIISPDQIPQPGQIRDSNSILVRSALHPFVTEWEQKHLPENFEAAWAQLDQPRLQSADLLLISGGSSVGDQDFTRPLLERLGFKIIFSQVQVRPGKPLIFGVNGPRLAFGLPGNPLSHFVCLHFAVRPALARLQGESALPKFFQGRLATRLADTACPRETLWPSRLVWHHGSPELHPLAWASSSDVTCLASTNILLRVPANCLALDAGAELEFLPVATMLDV